LWAFGRVRSTAPLRRSIGSPIKITKKNNSNKKQKQRQSSGVCATASIDVGDRAAQTILRSRYSSKVNSGYRRALGALVSR